ncbi:prephenate/arogenate dehydrogenase family protein [Acuticoccus sp.]|uniref:prephenate/arogenate dehydrogenase family protein n=1 Tax=Acuticoccus sp. TaxID=1904378 RepID=UPI003B52489D
MADAAPPAEGFGFSSIAIIGIGLIGASVALALREAGFTGPIAAADRDDEALHAAVELGIATTTHADAAQAAAEADMIILAVPVGAMEPVACAIGPVLSPRAIVTDVGSVKGAVSRTVSAALPDPSRFVPAHPIAGSEQSGPRAGYASLFRNRWCILTPTDETDPSATQVVADMWRAMGSNIEVMDVERHDLVLAITSHLPHLIAYNIVRTAYDMEAVTEAEVIKFSAGGFRDFTRLAASDPTMWRDVFLNNRAAVIETLGRFSEDLAILQRAIRWGEGDQLYDLFERTRAIRMGIVEAGQDTAAPDFGRPRPAAEERHRTPVPEPASD